MRSTPPPAAPSALDALVEEEAVELGFSSRLSMVEASLESELLESELLEAADELDELLWPPPCGP